MNAHLRGKGDRRRPRTAGSIALFLAFGLLNIAAADRHVQYVVIDKTLQTLSAYEDNHLVLQTRISSGKSDRSTPNGSFLAGAKSKMHYSRLYHNAPMPYSVHVTGNVFIHGYSVVPSWPASHGCIRVPLDRDNPARRFFEWVKVGARIDVVGHWLG